MKEISTVNLGINWEKLLKGVSVWDNPQAPSLGRRELFREALRGFRQVTTPEIPFPEKYPEGVVPYYMASIAYEEGWPFAQILPLYQAPSLTNLSPKLVSQVDAYHARYLEAAITHPENNLMTLFLIDFAGGAENLRSGLHRGFWDNLSLIGRLRAGEALVFRHKQIAADVPLEIANALINLTGGNFTQTEIATRNLLAGFDYRGPMPFVGRRMMSQEEWWTELNRSRELTIRGKTEINYGFGVSMTYRDNEENNYHYDDCRYGPDVPFGSDVVNNKSRIDFRSAHNTVLLFWKAEGMRNGGVDLSLAVVEVSSNPDHHQVNGQEAACGNPWGEQEVSIGRPQPTPTPPPDGNGEGPPRVTIKTPPVGEPGPSERETGGDNSDSANKDASDKIKDAPGGVDY